MREPERAAVEGRGTRAHGPHARRLLIVLGAALALRLLTIGMTPDYVPTGDPADYDRHAQTLQIAGVFAGSGITASPSPSAYRPPAYPLLLGGVYEIAGVSWTAARILGALLGTLAVGLLYLLVARVCDRRLALWAAGVAAAAPMLVWLNASLLSENLLTPLVAGFALCVAAFRDRPRLWLAALAGLLVGLAALTRTNALVFVLPLALGLWHGPRRLLAPALAVGCVLLALAPWAIRNASVFGEFLPLGTQGGYTMAAQWNTDATQPGEFLAVSRDPRETVEHGPIMRRTGLDEAELDAELRAAATEFASEHPGHVVRALAFNFLREFDVGPGHTFVSRVTYDEMAMPQNQRASARGVSYVLFALAIAGVVLVLRGRARRGPLWLWLIPLLLVVTVAPWTGKPRYRAPADLFLAIPAAVALVAWRDRRKGDEGPRAGFEAV